MQQSNILCQTTHNNYSMSSLRPRNTKQLLVSLSTTLIHSLHLKVLKCQERLNTFEVLSANFNTFQSLSSLRCYKVLQTTLNSVGS